MIAPLRTDATRRPDRPVPELDSRTGASLVLIGRPSDTEVLRDLLQTHFLVELRPHEDAVTAADDVDAETLAVLVSAPLPRRGTARAVAYLRGMLQVGARPVVVVAFEPVSPQREAALYRRGAGAVFAWPEDQDALVQFCMQLPSIAIKLPTRQEDAAAARRVRDRIRAATEMDPAKVRVTVRAGTVYLQGEVDALWKRNLIGDVAGQVEGVRHVVTRGLEVDPPQSDDRDVARAVDGLLAATAEIDETTLGVDVADGVVTLAGTVDHRDELLRVEELLAHVKGVRAIENLTTVSPATREQDAARARRLRRQLAAFAPDDELAVSVFGPVAVLRGRVSTVARRNAIGRWLRRRERVQRVVDRLRVDPLP